MRTAFLLLRNGRSPQNEAKVPFIVDLPMRLRNEVSGKNNINKEKGCLHEITLVLSCLEKYNYENSMCTKEVNNFQNCYKTYLNNKKTSKAEALKGNLVPGTRNLKYKQMNKLLEKYPQVNKLY